MRLHLDVYQRKEDVPTILFISGTGAHARCYAEFLFQLHGRGFRVVGIDLQGHGLSEGVRGSFTIEELVENIYDVTTWAIECYGERGPHFPPRLLPVHLRPPDLPQEVRVDPQG